MELSGYLDVLITSPPESRILVGIVPWSCSGCFGEEKI
jgi:hypothetical protein